MPNPTWSQLRLSQITTSSPAMLRCLKLARLASKSEVPVLVLGETGTGKTLLAQAIHNSSRRSAGRFVSFNASAMSDTLLESQLFGHEKGAFTGAQKAVKGKFELADSGTLFLDEIADMSMLAQAKILRAVEYGEFERLGSEVMRHANARIVSATNCSLRERIRCRTFREDLYHRLNGLTLLIPALRDRQEDLPPLIASELKAAAAANHRDITGIHPVAMEQLLNHPWPGNLRELHHTVRTITLFCDGSTVLPDHIVFQEDLTPRDGAAVPNRSGTAAGIRLDEFDGSDGSVAGPVSGPAETGPLPPLRGEALLLSNAVSRHIQRVYDQTNRNQRQTARLLGISRAKLLRHLKSMET